MSCTPPTVSRRLPAERRRDGGCRSVPRRLSGLFLSFLLLHGLLVGCRSPAEVHPEYARLAPSKVLVPPPVNRTIHQLDAVTFGGLLQRAVIGGDTYNVPRLLQGSVEDTLVLRGYSVAEDAAIPDVDPPDFRQPLPADAPLPDFDGICYAEILEWRSRRTSTSGLHMKYRLELYRVPTGELLFSGDFAFEGKGSMNDPEFENLAKLIRQSVRGALSFLPRAEES